MLYSASRDNDINPALEDAQANSPYYTLGQVNNQVWNTRLDEICYRRALDLNSYS